MKFTEMLETVYFSWATDRICTFERLVSRYQTRGFTYATAQRRAYMEMSAHLS